MKEAMRRPAEALALIVALGAVLVGPAVRSHRRCSGRSAVAW